MKRRTKATEKALARLHRSREQAETRLADVRQALDREIGWAPRKKVWVLPLVAFAFGLALAAAWRSRR